MNSGRANISVLSDCLRSIAVLRTFLHMYNKDIADVSQTPLFMLKDSKHCYSILHMHIFRKNKHDTRFTFLFVQAEDKVAQACYLAAEMKGAREHCEASIKVKIII